MGIISWLILGLLSGAIAKAIVPGYQGGDWLGTLLLGVIGAFLGGSLYGFFRTGSLQLIATQLTIPGVFVAVLGSILAIYIYGAFSRRNP
ncbi:MAG: hypothetical protein OHK0012_01970 [Synechococcales cyanobacterium]